MVEHIRIDYEVVLLIFISFYNALQIKFQQLADIIITNPQSLIESIDSLISLFVSCFSLGVVWLKYRNEKRKKK